MVPVKVRRALERERLAHLELDCISWGGLVRLILNAINGEFLRDITLNAVADTERVDAAVAYVSREDLLFDWCWKNDIPLRFWGRYDETVPVSPPILRRFLTRRSARYACTLVRRFHAKIIWWHGVGAYIGSANLSDRAWHSNVEAGSFYDEAELATLGLDAELREFFRVLDVNGSPLTEEIVVAIEARAKQLDRLRATDFADAKDAWANPHVKPWDGLVHAAKAATADRRRQAFLDEWNSAITLLRNLAVKLEEHRPTWVKDDAPSGAHVDQFLHAHYYNQVMEGGRSLYEERHQENLRDPDAAERKAMAWWKSLSSPPSLENRMLNEWAPFLRDALSPAGLRNRTEDHLFEIFKRVHSVADHARRIPNNRVGLPGTRQYSMDEKTRALARRLFQERSEGGADLFDLLQFVLHDGDPAETPMRLWEGLNAPKWKIDHVGRSALGEIVGWALPDRYPPRNSRTSKALRALGHPVAIY